jgi:Coenzyme PQQ synthesis protein D (PqqD)
MTGVPGPRLRASGPESILAGSSHGTLLRHHRRPTMFPSSDPILTTACVVVVGPDQVSSDLPGETVLLSMRDAHYYGLDPVGSRIWELISEPTRVSEICEVIVREFDVEADRCEHDVLRFLGDLAAKELIEVRVGD